MNLNGELMDWIPVVLAHEYTLDKKKILTYIIEAVPTILNMLDANDADVGRSLHGKMASKWLKENWISGSEAK